MILRNSDERYIKVTIVYKVNNQFGDILKQVLRNELIYEIEKHTHYTVLNSPLDEALHNRPFEEHVHVTDLTSHYLKIECLMTLNKKKYIASKVYPLFTIFAKPFMKTSTIVKTLETDIRYLLKLITRKVDPLGFGSMVYCVNVSRL